MITLEDIRLISIELKMKSPKYPQGCLDKQMSTMLGTPIIDIIAIDTHLHEKFNYDEEKDGSMDDFLKKNYPKAEKLIQKSF